MKLAVQLRFRWFASWITMPRAVLNRLPCRLPLHGQFFDEIDHLRNQHSLIIQALEWPGPKYQRVYLA